MSILDHTDEQGFADLLIGHRIHKIDNRTAVLDNGVELTFPDTDGGCACSSGCYDLTELNGVDNIITKVEIFCDPDEDYGPPEQQGVYTIFVYADNQKINLATWTGTDGNGYYGTGFTVHVKEAGT